MQNTIIYLFGFPGVGKYTIAKEICAQEPNFKLIDNHLINNPVFSLIRRDGETQLPKEVWGYTERIRDIVLEVAQTLADDTQSFVFTNMLTEKSKGDKEIYKKVEDLAKKRNADFIPVRLLCDVEENEKRIVSEDRNIRFKHTDPTSPKRYNNTDQPLKPDHKNLFELDVTNLSPAEATNVIFKAVKRIKLDKSSLR